VGRHLFWSSAPFEVEDIKRPAGFINQATLAGKEVLMDWLGIHFEQNVYLDGNHCPAQILRNAVHPRIGRRIFDQVTAGDGYAR
jgi:DNA (cytosine-5)-methyltransferase 1